MNFTSTQADIGEEYKTASLEEFYEEASGFTGKEIDALLPPGINKEIGHFNIFDIAETIEEVKRKSVMPYNRRTYYKISLIQGRSTAEYAGKVIGIERNALLFATPRVPYHWLPKDDRLSGRFCIFTADFMIKSKSGVELDDLSVFQTGGYPVFQLTDEQNEASYSNLNASARVTSLFIELLERQFPIESPRQKLYLRTAKDYAERLAIHVNCLNKALKENTGNTTTSMISSRIVQEAKILLKQTDWNISEIAYCLGFEEVAHFSNFFRKQVSLSPVAFRS